MTMSAAEEGRFGTAFEWLGIERAWSRTRGDPAVIVGIVDQGVQLDHPLLESNIKKDYSHHATGACDHETGTHLAGVAAGRASEAERFSGVAPGARILPVRYSDGPGPQALDLPHAIEYAVEMGASIITLSRAGTASAHGLTRAIQYAAARNVLVVSPACPPWTDLLTREDGEALPNLMTVVALDQRREPLTTHAGGAAHLAAPGFARVPRWRASGPAENRHKAIGAAYVSGCAALVKSVNQGWGYHELREHLVTSAVPQPALSPVCHGGAMLDVARAVMGPLELTMGESPLTWSSLEDAVVTWKLRYPSEFCMNAVALYRRHGDEHWRELGFARASVGRMIVPSSALRPSSGTLRVASREANFVSEELPLNIR